MPQKIYSGKIWSGPFGEQHNTIFIGYDSNPFSKRFEEDFNRKKVSVRYWVSDSEKTKEQLAENHLLQISGSVDADYGDRYSDLTGYLWTDDDAKVGGHSLTNELHSHIGKFLYMEIDY